MARYHVNPKTGNPNVCAAQEKCPFGSLDTDHYDSALEARQAYEASQKSSLLPPHRTSILNAFNELRGQVSVLNVEINELDEQAEDLAKAIVGQAALMRLGRNSDEQLLEDLAAERDLATDELARKRAEQVDLNRRINELHAQLSRNDTNRGLTSGSSYSRKGK